MFHYETNNVGIFHNAVILTVLKMNKIDYLCCVVNKYTDFFAMRINGCFNNNHWHKKLIDKFVRGHTCHVGDVLY